MKTVKIVTIVCWIITAVVLAGLVVWFLTGSVFGIGNVGFNMGLFEVNTGPFTVDGTYTVGTSGLDSVKIDWIAGSIRVEPYDGTEIKIVEYSQRELNENEKLRYNTSGGMLIINYRERSIGRTGRIPNKRVEVFLPYGFCESMNRFNIESTSGAIHTDGISADTFKVESTSGSLNLQDIKAQTFNAESLSGSVSLRNINAPKLTVESTSGSITITSAVSDDMKIRSLSGSVRVSDTISGKVDCETTSGSINISGDFYDSQLESLSGRTTLESSANNAVVKSETTSGSIIISGSFAKADIKSLSGSVTFKSSVTPASLKADTTSGSINVTVPNDGAVSVYHSATSGKFSSDIPVMLESRKGAQFELTTLSGSTKINVLD